MIDRGGAAKATGEILLEHSNVLFAWWHRLREGVWARSTFQWYVGSLRQSFREELARGSQGQCPKTAATCLELLARERALECVTNAGRAVLCFGCVNNKK
jgi:transposase